MSYGEDIIKLRKRVADAVGRGLVSVEDKDFLEGTLLQIMNDAERNRQNCVTQAENLRRQAAVADGQAGAFASTVSIVYNVLNGFVTADEKNEAERAKDEAEKSELEKSVLELDANNEAEVKKPTRKKK